MKKNLIVLTMFGTAALIAGCSMVDLASAVTPTSAPAGDFASAADTEAPAEPTATTPPVETPSDEPAAAEPVAPPVPFTIMLAFEADTVCGGAAFEFEYGVDVVDETMLLTQINAAITTIGPYDDSSGAFTATLSGLPGAETYTGVLTTEAADDGVVRVTMSGEYGYGDDAYFCDGGTSSQLFSGTTEVTP